MKKYKEFIVIIGLVIMLGIFFYRFTLYGANDFDEHYLFAFDLMQFKNMSLYEFLQQIEYSHILAYPLWHIFFLIVFYINRYFFQIIGLSLTMEMLCAISTAVVNTMCLLGVYIVIRKVYDKYFVNYVKRSSKTVVSIMTLFWGPLYLPGIFTGYYMGPKTGNVWHNPTFLVVKPLAILIFFMYLDILEQYDMNIVKKRDVNKKLIIVSAFLMVSALAKPSFYQMFLPGLVLYCILDLIRTRGKSFGFLFKIGLSVVPVCVLGIIQIIVLGAGDEGGTIGVELLKVWKHWTPYWYVALVISIAFPLFVFALKKCELFQDKKTVLGICIFLSGLMQYMFFYIKKAPYAGDFGWGLSLALFLLFIVSIIECDNMSGEKEKIGICLCKGLFVLHFVFGLIYFWDIFKYLDYVRPLTF